MTPLSNALCFTHTTSGSPTFCRAELGISSSPLHGSCSASGLGTPGGKRSWHQGGLSWGTYHVPGLALGSSLQSRGGRDEPPHCAHGETGSSQRGLGAPQTARLRARVGAGAVCGAGVPSSGRRGPARGCWTRKSLIRAAGGSARRGPTSQELRTISPNLSSWLPRDPTAAARPAPIAMETACTQLPPSPLPCPK